MSNLDECNLYCNLGSCRQAHDKHWHISDIVLLFDSTLTVTILYVGFMDGVNVEHELTIIRYIGSSFRPFVFIPSGRIQDKR